MLHELTYALNCSQIVPGRSVKVCLLPEAMRIDFDQWLATISRYMHEGPAVKRYVFPLAYLLSHSAAAVDDILTVDPDVVLHYKEPNVGALIDGPGS